MKINMIKQYKTEQNTDNQVLVLRSDLIVSEVGFKCGDGKRTVCSVLSSIGLCGFLSAAKINSMTFWLTGRKKENCITNRINKMVSANNCCLTCQI